MYGELIPLGGGDPIPLPNPKRKKQLLIGRRESCDIVLRFANVSAHHCQLMIESGYWYVRDLQSRNGIKINDVRVDRSSGGSTRATSSPIAKHKYRVEYDPAELGAVGPPPADNLSQEIMQRVAAGAGRARPPRHRPRTSSTPRRRYDPTNMKAGQIELPDEPV